jgi:nucleoside-diphosphate-sugar epimerase
MVFDCSKTAKELGLKPRPIRQSLTEMLPWLIAEGYLSA